MNVPLTERQQEILDFISEHIALEGRSPTVREIGKAFKIASPNGVMCHIKAMQHKGAIRVAGKSISRGISIPVPEGFRTLLYGEKIIVQTDGPLTMDQARLLGTELLDMTTS